MTEDSELLRRYAKDGTEDAFAELVRRHLGLVYRSALRQVGGDNHRAEEIAQSVFCDLARKAAQLTRHTSLIGWLYTSTRFAAAKAMRSERRRLAHETNLPPVNLLADRSENVVAWHHLQPVIDDALHNLNEPDRRAVLLRFFEGRSFEEIGIEMRLTANAARMRVERALEKLRAQLARRGVTSTSAALSLALADSSAAAIPAALAANVTSAALASAGTAVSAGTILSFMTAAKTLGGLAAVAALLAVGVAVFEARELEEAETAADRLAFEKNALQRQLDLLERQLQQSGSPEAAAGTSTAAIDLASADDPMVAAVRSFLDEFEVFQAWLMQNPDQQIPELAFLTQRDWLGVMLRHFGGNDTDNVRRTLGDLRNTARGNFARVMRYALTHYVADFPDTPLTDMSQLKPYFDPPVDDAILDHWEVLTEEARSELPRGSELLVAEKASARIDDYDSLIRLGPLLRNETGGMRAAQTLSADAAESEALELFQTVNRGTVPVRPEQLVPYFRDPQMGRNYLRLETQASSP